MSMLKSKCKYNLFGDYHVLDYSLHIEFQYRGSPQAHFLLWLENDPKEAISETMEGTIQLTTDMCSVSRHDVSDEKIHN